MSLLLRRETSGTENPPRPSHVAVLRPRGVLFGSFAAFIICVLILNPLYVDRINPDATAYFSLAQKWARGDWQNAISGHWPPLFSWLIASGLKFGLSCTTSVTIIDVIAGCFLLAAANSLISRTSLKQLSQSIVLATVGIFALYFTFSAITPDLLLSALLTCYLAVSSTESQTRRTLWIAGSLGGLAFLAKPIALDFVFAHYLLASILDNRRCQARWSDLGRRVRTVTITLVLVAAPWIGCLSLRYHHFTLGTAGESAFRLGSPLARKTRIVNIGLAALPNATAYNYWEDPEQLNLPYWSPLSSKSDFQFFVGFIKDNVAHLILLLELTSIVAIPALGYGWFRWWRGDVDRTVTFLLCASFLLPPAYCLFDVLDRYLLPTMIWLLLLAVRLAPGKSNVTVVSAFLCFSFWPYPLFGLVAERYQGRSEREVGNILAAPPGLKGNLASLSDWHRSLYVSYFAGVPYYGMAAEGSADEILHDLQKFRISYLLVWKDRVPPPHLLDGMKLMENEALPSFVHIYEVPQTKTN